LLHIPLHHKSRQIHPHPITVFAAVTITTLPPTTTANTYSILNNQ
jgi:hypothetical protein